MKKVILGLLLALSSTFAQYSRPDPWRLWGMGFVGFVYLVLGFFLFSIIFWFCYTWIVKGRDKKDSEKKD